MNAIGTVRAVHLACNFRLMLLGLMFICLTAWGQDSETDANMDYLFSLSLEQLLTIKVHSTSYFDESLWESSATVSPIDQAKWQQQGSQNVSDAISFLPSTYVTDSPSGGKSISIRGYTNASSNRGIGVRLDGLPMNTYRIGAGIQDIHQFQLGVLNNIEVIRGAGSTLHGSDAFHGVISMTSKDAQPKQYEFAMEGDGQGYQQGRVLAGTQLSKHWRSSMAFSYSNTPDQHQSYQFTHPNTPSQTLGERAKEVASYSAIMKLTYQKADQSRYINFYALHHKSNQFPGLGRTLTATSFQLNQDWINKGMTSHIVKVGLTQKISNDTSFDINGFYRETQDLYKIDARITSFSAMLDEDRGELQKGINLTLKLSPKDSSHRLAVGYEYRHHKLNRFDVVTTLGSGTVIKSEGSAVGIQREVHSLILDGRFQGQEKIWQLAYGARVDNYSDFGEHFSPRLGLIITPEIYTVYKVIYGNAFRAPGVLESEGAAPNVEGNSSIKPEVIDSLDFVFLYQQLSWNSNLTLFFNRWQDGIIVKESSSPGFTSIYKNQGENEAYGIELSANKYWENWQGDVNFSYVKSKNSNDNLQYEGFPPYLINLGIAYEFPNHDLAVFLKQSLHLEVKEGSPNDNVKNPKSLPNFYRTDIVIQWQPKTNMSVRGNIRNLFDRKNFRASPGTHENGLPDTGLNISLEFEYKM